MFYISVNSNNRISILILSYESLGIHICVETTIRTVVYF